jgi:drug/metabolite transporter (DMT)-like permease
MILFPILGAISKALAEITERFVLMKKIIKTKQYQALQFIGICFFLIPLLFLFWKLEPEALNPKNILILVLIGGISIAANWFTFTSMKWQKLSKLEPAKMTEPLFVVILALIFSYIIGPTIYERNFQVLIPAIIAGLALVFSHIKKHHLKFSKYFVFALIGSLLYAFELVFAKLILDFYSPITFYFARSFLVLIGTLIIFRPNIFENLDSKTKFQVILASFLWVIYRLTIYFGYSSIGIAKTTLILMLAPIFVYIIAWKFLKEKLTWKNIVASIIIIGCVIYTILI